MDSEDERIASPPVRSTTVLIGDTSRRNSVSSDLDLNRIAADWLLKLNVDHAPLPEDLDTIALDETNQRVIRYDCERTRGSMEEFKDEKTRKLMEQILTFFCKSNSISYKQGMNEVLAPFVWLRLQGALTTDQQIYSLYSGFISIFLGQIFSDEEFLFLQKCCVLFKTCLRYHAPSLSSRLDAAAVTPEMFVTPWFLTLFASKTSLSAVIHLWDLLIARGDKHSFAFLAVSLCLSHARLLRASAQVSLPETITKISIADDAVESVWKRAAKIRQHTPPGFTQQLVNAADWDGQLDRLTAPHLEKQLGEVFPMQVRPMDLFRRPAEGWKYVVLDCRPDWLVASGQIGSLPLSVPFDLESLVAGQSVFPVGDALKRVADLLAVDISAPVPQWPLENHICILGLSDFVIDATGLLYVALAKLSNVPRVSIVRGGYLGVHHAAPQELIDHDAAACPLCNGVPISSLVEKPGRARAHSNASSYGDSSASSPVSTGGGGFMQRFRTLSSAVASGTSSLIGSSSKFFIGTVPPLPTSKSLFFPANEDQLVLKCTLREVMGRTPATDIEANALLVVGTDFVRCFAAPLDMTVLTQKCELRLYGGWPVGEVNKITSKTDQPATLQFYFSVESAPDLVISLVNGEIARNAVSDLRRKYRQTKKTQS